MLIVIDKKDEVSSWLRELGHDNISCVRLDIGTFEISSGLDTELIFIQESLLESISSQLKLKLENCAGLIIFTSQNVSHHINLKNLLAVIRQDDPIENSINILINNEERIKHENILKSQLLSMNAELSHLMGNVENELWKVKSSREKILPRRLEQLEGIKIFSKYSAGERSGGEFFDLFEKNGSVFILISHTSSYLASSIILQCFSEFKKVGILTPATQKSLINMIEKKVAVLSESQGSEIELELFTGVYNLECFELSLVKKGQFELTHSDSGKLEVLDQEVVCLEEGQRLMMSSPGFKKSWKDCASCIDIEKLVKDPMIKSLDILDESFYQLKKSAESNFLERDAAIIILEVEANVK